MKIGFVFDDTLDNNDGIQQYMLALRPWFESEGHEIHFLVGETKRTDIPNIHSLSRNIKVRFNGNRLSIPWPASKKRIRALLARETFDVLHVQTPYHPLMAGRVMRLAPPQTVVFGTFHIAPYSSLVTFATKMLGLWSRSSSRRFNELVSVSPAAQAFARQTFELPSDIVPNAVQYARFKAAAPFDDGEVKTITFLGRLVPRKGCMVLLQAVAELHAAGGELPPFKVVICGGGPLEAELQAFVTQANLTDIVRFAGRVSEEDKPRYLASSDISVFPSSAGESFGIVLVEAMASGKAAVLGGDNPGYRSVLGEQPELLFRPTDVLQLADKLRWLLTDDAARQQFAAWGGETVKQYDAAVVGAELIKRYKNHQ